MYDEAGRLHLVYDGIDLAATYTYYDNGALQKVVYGNGASEEYTYFADGNLDIWIKLDVIGKCFSYSYSGELYGDVLDEFMKKQTENSFIK